MKPREYILRIRVVALLVALSAWNEGAYSSFSIRGTGDADGSVVERIDYSSTGDFAGGGPGVGAFYHDSDDDFDIDLLDFANFQNCFGQTDPTCLALNDFDTADTSDGDIDLDDYARFSGCFRGPFVTPDQACGIPQRPASAPASGIFTLHGRAADILSDDHTLLDFRARFYVPALGRGLQRDPTGYADGVDLYEAFRGDSVTNVDPLGTEVWGEASTTTLEVNLAKAAVSGRIQRILAVQCLHLVTQQPWAPGVARNHDEHWTKWTRRPGNLAL